MKWWRYIFDERLPNGCRLFPACISCPAYCYGKKLHEKEILGYDREEETKRIIERIKNTRKEIRNMKDCTTCKYGYEDERLDIPMCLHPKRFYEECVDFNMHEEKEIKESNMDKIEKIRQEIERRKNICEGVFERESDTYYQGKAVAYGELLTFLNTLSKEPDKSLEEKLNEEIKRFVTEYDYERSEDILLIAIVARHFAKWGADHTPLPEDTVIFNKGIEEGKRLMMEDAVEKTVGQLERQWGGNIHFMHGFEVDEMDFPFLNSQECGYGDRVRIIIVKEDGHE